MKNDGTVQVNIPDQIYKYMVDNFGDMLVITDSDYNIIDANSKALLVFERSLSEMQLLNIKTLLPNDINQIIAQTILTKQSSRSDFYRTSIPYDGNKLLPVNYRFSLCEIEGLTYYYFRFVDLTQQIKIENDLYETEASYIMLFEQNLVGVGEIDLVHARFLRINDKYSQILGYTREEMLSLNVQAITHPDDVQEKQDAAKLLFEGKTDHFTLETRYLTKSDQFIWVILTIVAAKSKKAQHTRYFSIIHDISEFKKMQEDLLISQERLRVAQEFGNVSSWEYYLDTDIVWSTANGFKMFGYDHPEGEMSVSRILRTVPELGQLMKALSNFISGEGHNQIELVVNPADGSPQRTIIAAAELIKDNNGNPIIIKGVSHDITDLVSVQNELNESQEKYAVLAQLLSNSTQPMAIGYPDGTLGLHNKAFLDLIGYEETEIPKLNADPKATTPVEWREDEKITLKKALTERQPIRYEKEYIKKDGSRVPVEILAQPIFETDGKVKYYYAFITDISERKALQQSLADKVADFINVFDLIDIGAAFLRCLRDENGDPIDYRVILTNNAFNILTGYNAEDDIDPLKCELGTDNKSICWQNYIETFTKRKPVRFELKSHAQNRDLLIRAYPSEPDTIIVFVKDITDVKWEGVKSKE